MGFMRTALAALLLTLAAPVAVLAAAPAGKPAASPAPTAEATPAKAPEPGANECSATSAKDGALLGTSRGDYQACLRDVKAQVAKACDGTQKQISFVFHRGGQKSITMAAVCN